jgi:hypothetical protein
VINAQGDSLEIPDLLETTQKERFGQKTRDRLERCYLIKKQYTKNITQRLG